MWGQKPLIKFMRALLLLPLFLGCFHDRQETSGTWHGVYAYGGRTLACVALFFFGNVLKSLGAKLMAGSFHRASQFAKMQEGLRRVSLSLCTRRHDEALGGRQEMRA